MKIFKKEGIIIMCKKLLVLLLCGIMLIGMLASCVDANQNDGSTDDVVEEDSYWVSPSMFSRQPKMLPVGTWSKPAASSLSKRASWRFCVSLVSSSANLAL